MSGSDSDIDIINNDDEEYTYTLSGSEREDWGDDEWDVDKILEEHTDNRGNKRTQVGWRGWHRDDGSWWTWERQDSTTMDDISSSNSPVVMNAWTKKQVAIQNAQAKESTIKPFYLYREPEAAEERPMSQKARDLPKVNKAKRHKVPIHALYTEFRQQMEELGVDAGQDRQNDEAASFSETLRYLEELRETRARTLSEHGDISINMLVSRSWLGLGSALETEVQNGHQPTPESLIAELSNVQISKSSSKPNWKRREGVSRVSDQGTSSPIRRPNLKRRGAAATITVASSATSSTRKFVNPSLAQRTKDLSVRYPSVASIANTVEPAIPSQLPNRPLKKLPSRTHGPRRGSGSLSAKLSLRKRLQDKWQQATQRANAARITFANDVNDEEIPGIDLNEFEYLEQDYVYDEDVLKPEREFMESCDCKACSAATCTCQADAGVQDNNDYPVFAYDKQGLFVFRDITGYVIECNKNCKCNPSCQSRIAQRPRIVPIEIFRTQNCGWGVRSPVRIKKGTVLGVYTGLLISRKTARKFTEERGGHSYIFDLDFMDDASDPQFHYSVDAYDCGNWTRFVNHSCQPTCSLYSVIWDSVPAMHQPKLAFVAIKDISPGIELTIDYCPQAKEAKGKGRASSMNCMCEAENCRGFIYMN